MIDVKNIIDDEPFEAWLPYYDKDVRVKVRFIQQQRLTELKQKAYKGGIVNNARLWFLIAKECILDWEGFYVDDKPLECTPENIELMLQRLTGLAQSVSGFASEYTTMYANKLAEEKKISGST
jgi:hypothetical protein